MTALEVFERCARADNDIARIEEKIERRRALAMGCTAKPADSQGGGGSKDASMKLVDYMADLEALEDELQKRKNRKAMDIGCAVYLAEQLPDTMGSIMVRCFLCGQVLRDVAGDLGYSMSHIKRMKREAEQACRNIRITWWDGEHVPVLSDGNRIKVLKDDTE